LHSITPKHNSLQIKTPKMITTLRTALLLFIFTFFFADFAEAQPNKGEYIDASIGLGISVPYDNIDLEGTGFYAQGEYALALTSWFGLRPYAGVIFTSPDKSTSIENRADYKVTSKAFLMGAKARIAAPIPWVAPYVEGGIGASIGKFETYTPYTKSEKSGLLVHIPFTLGLALGPKNNVDVAFTYYFHPAVEQISGAAAIGLSFPINKG